MACILLTLQCESHFCTYNKLCFKLFSISDYSLIIHRYVIGFPVSYLYWTSLVVQTIKCLPAMQKTWVRSLGLEDPLEKEMAIHSSILVWKIPWMEKPGGLQSVGSQRVRHDWATSLSFFLLYINLLSSENLKDLFCSFHGIFYCTWVYYL